MSTNAKNRAKSLRRDFASLRRLSYKGCWGHTSIVLGRAWKESSPVVRFPSPPSEPNTGYKRGSEERVVQLQRPMWWRRELLLLYASMTVARIGFGVMIILFPSYLARSSNVSLALVLALY